MAGENAAWQLEELVDSLVVELDKTRETLAVKAINKPLSYTVKDLALELNIFPSYDGDQVKFVTAQPGQQGASKVSIQLGSITDQQVRATTKAPTGKQDLNIDQIDVDTRTKRQLRKLGVKSVEDLQQIQKKNVDLEKVSESTIDYKRLANQIQKSRRNETPPRVRSVSLSRNENQAPQLVLRGENLAMDRSFKPVAVINETLAEVTACNDRELTVALGAEHQLAQENELVLTFDPFAVMKINVRI